MSSPASNTRECFREFVGQRMKGLLFDVFPMHRHDLSGGSKTLVFEDGRGLTIASNGSYWIESAADVLRAVEIRQAELDARKADIAEVLALAGVLASPTQEDQP